MLVIAQKLFGGLENSSWEYLKISLITYLPFGNNSVPIQL